MEHWRHRCLWFLAIGSCLSSTYAGKLLTRYMATGWDTFAQSDKPVYLNWFFFCTSEVRLWVNLVLQRHFTLWSYIFNTPTLSFRRSRKKNLQHNWIFIGLHHIVAIPKVHRCSPGDFHYYVTDKVEKKRRNRQSWHTSLLVNWLENRFGTTSASALRMQE